MEVIDCDQRSEKWQLARVGRITASRFKDVLASGKGSAESKTRLSYMKQLRAEMLTGLPAETYSNSYMEWGIANEAAARQHYANESGNEIVQVGFIVHNEYVGASPDGLVGDDGIIEIKCPKSETHLDYIDANEVPTCYYAQIQGNLWIAERQWADFVSFDPRVKCRPYFCKRLKRDETYIKALEFAVNKFIKELKEMVNLITNEGEEF